MIEAFARREPSGERQGAARKSAKTAARGRQRK